MIVTDLPAREEQEIENGNQNDWERLSLPFFELDLLHCELSFHNNRLECHHHHCLPP